MSYLYEKKSPYHHTIVEVQGVKIGGDKIAIMAGPCAVETAKVTADIARAVKELGADVLRGGAYKPRTSPYSFQGMGHEAVDILYDTGRLYHMPIISEVTGVGQLEELVAKVDILQVGARSMQNYELLKAVGKADKPVLLKRGFCNTIEELLLSAEYVLSQGNPNVILCERGIRTFENSTRNTLDISAIPILKRLTHLPVVADPSHSGGVYWLVKPLALAAIAAGADGIIVEVHTDPTEAGCDPEQALTVKSFGDLMLGLKPVAAAVGRIL